MTRYRRRALRLATGITGNHADAEDVVQDAFWTVVRKIDAFRGDSAFGSWLYRIVVNAAYQDRRRRRATQDHASLDDVVPGAVRDLRAAAEDPALRAERRYALAAAMDELPTASRAVVILREVEGRSNVEVADALGLTAGVAAVHVAGPFLEPRPRAQDRAPEDAVVRAPTTRPRRRKDLLPAERGATRRDGPG